MKNKLFLTSMVAVMLACPAYADLPYGHGIDSNGDGYIGSQTSTTDPAPINSADCDSDPLTSNNASESYGTYTLTAQWTPDKCPIVLDPHTEGYGATSSTPATLYAIFGDAVYLESTTTNAMTTSTNGLTQNPTGKTYTLTLNPSLPTGHTTSEISGSTGYAASTTAQMEFKGFYSATQSTGTTTNGTKYIDTDKLIETYGITAGTSIQSTNGVCPTTTWHAQYTCQNAATYTPLLKGYTFEGWYSAASGGTQVNDFCLTSDKEVFAHWSKKSYEVEYVCDNASASVSSVTPNTPSGKTNPDSVTYENPYAFWNPASTCVVPGKTATAWECVGNDSGTTINQTTNAASWVTAEDVTCTAQYDTNMVNLEFVYNNGSDNEYDSCNYGVGNFTVPQPTKPGYTFTGWKVTGWTGSDVE